MGLGSRRGPFPGDRKKIMQTARHIRMALVMVLCTQALYIAAAEQILLPHSKQAPGDWRYTFESPRADWFKPGYNDADWSRGPGGFGTEETPNTLIGTKWNTKEIWLRRTFELDRLPQDELYLQLHHDEDTTAYINGIKAAEVTWYNTDYELAPVAAAAAGALRVGENVIAMHCRQTTGGQYIDAGLIAIKDHRWSQERAWEWYNNQPWPCGFNYVPANAISYTEMWMPYCFDPEVIDKELALAQGIGFNCLRVVLPFVVWEHEPSAFKERLDLFLGICQKHGIRVKVTLFDDCAFGSDPKLNNPWYGEQPDVLEGWYANGWTPSPGHDMVRDPSSWPRLEKYVRDVIGAFKADPRVWVWDLYNEPTNGGLGDVSLPLVRAVFGWAREVDPSQPLTVAQWNDNARLNDVIFRNSDIITFHDYGSAEDLARHIASLRRHQRPIINNEWLNRGRGSRVETCLPVFAKENVGCMHWGLVNGKTQTDLHWGWRPGMGEPEIWQHDLYHGDHRPYDQAELDLFQKTISGRE
jgi:hypothetical protein